MEKDMEQKNLRAAEKAASAGTDRLFSEGPVLPAILKFALPTVLALLVNSFYNITDQLFISRILGVCGNAVTNTSYPVSVLIMAVAAMLGDGTATFFSLRLGKGETAEAAAAVRTMLLTGLIAGLAILLAGELFLDPLLRLLSVTEATRNMAVTYVRVILCGAPFVILGTGLTGLIRVDGSPRYAMFTLAPGCIFNIIFDGIFMLAFPMGIFGAALATVLGQTLNFIIAAAYLPRFKTVRILPENGSICVPAASLLRLGIAGFVNQFALAFYTVIVNKCLVRYGGQSVYGADIPLAAYGVMVKVSQLSYCFLNGISAGMQPLLGYNYGKGNIPRVKQCLKTALASAGVCGIFFFALYEGLPRQIMLLFGGGSELYMDYGIRTLRIFLFALPVAGISIVSTGLFQAIGKPKQSTVMALARQFIFFVPLVLILSRRYGVVGLLYASPIGDICAFIVCICLLAGEWKELNGRTEQKV